VDDSDGASQHRYPKMLTYSQLHIDSASTATGQLEDSLKQEIYNLFS